MQTFRHHLFYLEVVEDKEVVKNNTELSALNYFTHFLMGMLKCGSDCRCNNVQFSCPGCTFPSTNTVEQQPNVIFEKCIKFLKKLGLGLVFLGFLGLGF